MLTGQENKGYHKYKRMTQPILIL